MSWIDIAGAVAAQRHSSKEVVTASIDQLNFIAPIRRGWVVNLKASVNYASKSSMEIGVRVDAENPKTGEMFHTASAYLTFVAIGSDGRPSKVPALELTTEEDHRRFKAAEERRSVRLASRTKK